MKRNILRTLAFGAASATAAATLVAGAVSSQAASIGGATFTPASGVDANSITLSTAGACPAGATNFQIFVTGSGFANVPVTANNSISILPGNAAGGYDVPLQDTMANFAQLQSPPATLAGDYTFSGVCKKAIGSTQFGSYDGVLTFTNHAFVTKVQAVNYTTATSLASAPASPVNTGAPVTFTASVASTPAGGATGTVQLFDGTTAIGSPTAVDASGLAAITTSFSTAGSHSVTAAFTGSAANVGNSTSTPIVYTVNAAPATDTATALSISPNSATSADTVTLTATVTPAGAAGKVQFADGGTNLGSAVTVSGSGSATYSGTVAEGAHSFTASFVPTNAAVWNASTSASQAYTVAHFAGAQGSETIRTTINPGSLTISVDSAATVVLPSPTLNTDATFLTTSGPINPVTVTDTRAGNPGWTVSGQVSDFHNTTGPDTTPINGFNLGWVPVQGAANSPGQTVQLGATVDPAAPPVTADLPATDGHGLKVSRVLAKTDAGHGTGTAHVGATLNLNVPTTVIAGTYDATLTLTAI